MHIIEKLDELKIKGNYVGEIDSRGSNPSKVLYTVPSTMHFFLWTIKKHKRIWI